MSDAKKIRVTTESSEIWVIRYRREARNNCPKCGTEVEIFEGSGPWLGAQDFDSSESEITEEKPEGGEK